MTHVAMRLMNQVNMIELWAISFHITC